MKQTDIKGKTVSGVVWSLAEKVMTQGFSFVIGIVLARLLLPEDYGYVVIASTVIDIAGNLLDGGLTDVLIQRKDTDEEHSSTLLYFTLGAALLFYGIFFVSAPWISKIYDIPILVPVIRIYGLTLPITAIRTFFMALMQKDLKFKRLFVSSFAGTIIGGTLGIVMAVMNYGIWALVAYLLTDVIIDTIVMAIMLGWRPRPVFSITKLKSLLKEAFHSLGSNLATRYSSQLIELLIGVKYTAAELSFYNRGKQYPTVMCNTLNNALGSVMFPVLSDIADDSEKFKKAMRRMLKTSTYLQFPMLFGFAVVTEPLIRLVLTEKWLPAVPFIQLTCITYSFWPYITCYTKAINAKGEFGRFRSY